MRNTSTRRETGAARQRLRNGMLIPGIVLLGSTLLGCPSAEVVPPAEVQPAAEHPNETLVRDYISAGGAAGEEMNIERLREIIHEDVVMHFFGDNPVSGVHRGREETWGSLAEEWGARELGFEILEVTDIVVNDERAVLLMTVRIFSPETSVEANRVDVYQIVDGRIVEIWVYDDTQDEIDALFR